MKKDLQFAKLPDQDDFLLELQNSNYSMQTVYNYARDLCIFALFLHSSGVTFEDLSKKEITLYKGYLRKGDHLLDLDEFREMTARNAGMKALDVASSSEGSKTHDKVEGTVSTPDGVNDLGSNSEVVPKYGKNRYLDDVYRKVYGYLGRGDKARQKKSNGEDGLDALSVNRMLSALRSYLKYRIDFDLEIPIPPDAVKLIKTTKKKKQVAEFDQLVQLIESPMEFERNQQAALRNRAMLEILFSTGMRISELISLDIEQINSDGKLFITGKGKKQRFVYLTPRAMEWLDKYLELRLSFVGVEAGDANSNEVQIMLSDGDQDTDNRETNPDVSRSNPSETETESDLNTKFLKNHYKYIELCENYRQSGFLSKFNSPALFIPFSGGRNGKRGVRLSTNFFQEKIAEYRRRIGISVPTSAHSLRHGFATYLAENGAPAAAIQILLGHESLSTTTKYVHASDKFAAQVHKEKHPLG